MSESNVELVRSFYTALHALDLSAMLAVLDQNIQFRHPAAAPWGGDDRGHAGARRFFEQLAQSVDARFEVTDVSDTSGADEAGDITVGGELRGHARATGAPLAVHFVHTWTVSNGRLTGLDEHLDLSALFRALGHRAQPAVSSPWAVAETTRGRLLTTPRASRHEAGTVGARSSIREAVLAGQMPSAPQRTTEDSDVYLSFRQAFGPASWDGWASDSTAVAAW